MRDLVIPFVKAADDEAPRRATGAPAVGTNVLVDTHKPAELAKKLMVLLPDEPAGKDGLLDGIAQILKYSVNTWDQGFMDKLYSSTNPVSPPF